MEETLTVDDVLQRARGGDADAFAELAEGNRVRLFRHCYRMLGSVQEAEEALQDTMVRAWQRLGSFDGRGSFPGWMYRIATNICIDRLRGRKARTHPVALGPPARSGTLPQAPEAGVDWVEPVADEAIGLDPSQVAVGRERISLAFVAALQHLSPRQRGALLLHDVLDFSHDEVAEVLGATPSAVNSLLYRARETIGTSPLVTAADPDDPEVKTLLARYVRAWELADISELVATVSDDVRLSMPPLSTWYEGASSVAAFVEDAIFSQVRPHGITMVAGRANGQPALATYAPRADGQLVVDGVQILDVAVDGSSIVAITSFRDPEVAVRCGFARTL